MFSFKLFTPGQINKSELRNKPHLLDIHRLHLQIILTVDAASISGTVFEVHLVHKIVASTV